MSRVLVNGQDVNYTSDFPEMTYDKWKALPEDLRPNYTVITDRDYTGEPLDVSVSVTGDGVKTYAQLLNELYALVDKNKLTRDSVLKVQDDSTIFTYYQLYQITPTSLLFANALSWQSTGSSMNRTMYIASSDSKYTFTTFSGNYQDTSSSVVASGFTITLYYNATTRVIESCDAEDVSYGSSNVKAALDNLTANNISMSSSTQLQSGTTPFTAPSDGYLIVNSTSSSTTAYVALGTVPIMTQFNGSSSVWGWGSCFLRKGTEVNIIVNGTGSYYYFASLT